ncbi:MAG: prephenate dehydrogenase/arogenate dehydrogenase family protein, partial [Ghiorsea sp.]|nr:prephenate dehydrogenase/arogenate dehydrogenase family protein [Ghiorsea sp.]
PDTVSFVPAHPLAGTEKSGADAAFSSLYQDHLCIITPGESTDKQALNIIEKMWQDVGANVVNMPADEHDKLLGAVSHLPHLAAFALVNAVNKQKTDSFDPLSFAAGGFKDFTRIASSSPEMWRDIALANRDALEEQIDILMDELQNIRVALQASDKESLTALFSSAKDARDAWLAERKEIHKKDKS